MKSARASLLILMLVCLAAIAYSQRSQRAWLAGDSHVHSHWSPGYDRTKSPPEPIPGGDALYFTPMNAQKAREFGLSWIVTTDHGGPNHSRLNLISAYAELTQSRKTVADVLQFYGMELNMPAMDHHTLIIPNTPDEWKVLFNIESQFDSAESWPPDPARNSEAMAYRALMFMNAMQRLPLLFANHPSRSATGVGEYRLDDPREFRNNNDLAPDVYHGMEGGPGHQAATLSPDGGPKLDSKGLPAGFRGSYGNSNAQTFGGFDQMTAIVGGLWDSLLGEGRRFWIVATSDSHAHYSDPVNPGSDFWPGEYHKTYVHAYKTYDDILGSLRAGRIFAVSGDLIREFDLAVESAEGTAETGGTLAAVRGADVRVTIRFRAPRTPNAHGEIPKVRRVDLIVGDLRGPVSNRSLDRNDTTKVVARFSALDWKQHNDAYTIVTALPKLDRSVYLRVRGTNSEELEPAMDLKGESPWRDLWFYSNPVFVEVE